MDRPLIKNSIDGRSIVDRRQKGFATQKACNRLSPAAAASSHAQQLREAKNPQRLRGAARKRKAPHRPGSPGTLCSLAERRHPERAGSDRERGMKRAEQN